jgi:hypothetical protein
VHARRELVLVLIKVVFVALVLEVVLEVVLVLGVVLVLDPVVVGVFQVFDRDAVQLVEAR